GDWSKYKIVSDVSPQATHIVVGMNLHGSGQLWMDGARLEVVGNDVPTTDDHNFHLYTDLTSNYSAALDPAVQRNGHPTLCINSDAKPTHSSCWYGVCNRAPESYLGHRIRVTGWIKTENVTGGAVVSVWAWTPQGKLIGNHDLKTR